MTLEDRLRDLLRTLTEGLRQDLEARARVAGAELVRAAEEERVALEAAFAARREAELAELGAETERRIAAARAEWEDRLSA
ncbi:MAG TPA: hypothetical protein VNK92_06475, partial [Vicinamibacterales bacterium]|nr:hypothetical protein [Vicinamibacterales bacterium]